MVVIGTVLRVRKQPLALKAAFSQRIANCGLQLHSGFALFPAAGGRGVNQRRENEQLLQSPSVQMSRVETQAEKANGTSRAQYLLQVYIVEISQVFLT